MRLVVLVVLVLVLVLLVTGVKQSQLLVLRLSLEFDKIASDSNFFNYIWYLLKNGLIVENHAALWVLMGKECQKFVVY